MAKNPIWQEVDMLCIYSRFQGVELAEKQLQLSGQSGTWTCNLRIDQV